MDQFSTAITSVFIQTGPPGTAQRRVLGRFLAERQVEFASALGAREVILLGGGTAEAVATRHRAEELGLKLREISGPHALAAVVNDADRLLVLQQNLLPTRSAFALGGEGEEGVQILSAGVGAEAGFERIDLARAWSGALVIEGRRLGALLELPEDAETAPAILRIALQARLPEKWMSEEALADGGWTLLGEQGNLAMLEDKWLARLVLPTADAPVSRRLVGKLLLRSGSRIAGNVRWISAMLAVGSLLCLGAIGLSWPGMGPWAFAIIVLAVFAFEGGIGLKRLATMPFEPGHWWQKLPWLVDLSFFASGILALHGIWPHRIFPPLVAIALLHIARGRHKGWLGSLRDRALLAAIVAVVGASGGVEAGIMLVALLLAGLSLLPSQDQRR